MAERWGQEPVLDNPNPNSQRVMYMYTSVDVIILNPNPNSDSEREMHMYTSIDVNKQL